MKNFTLKKQIDNNFGVLFQAELKKERQCNKELAGMSKIFK
ncbi:MAG: hypothetical protein WC644_07695 [Ignavibacteria bacterium]